MALKWLRRHQKRVLIPLTVVLIFTFVFLWGGSGRGRGRRGAGPVALLGGQPVTGVEHAEYLRLLLSLRSSINVSTGEFAPFHYLSRAIAAERAGVAVSRRQLRDVVRAIMSTPFWIGSSRFTEAEYRRVLSGHRLTAPAFESFLEKILAGVLKCQENYPAYSAAIQQTIKGWDWKDRAADYYALFRRLLTTADPSGLPQSPANVRSRS